MVHERESLGHHRIDEAFSTEERARPDEALLHAFRAHRIERRTGPLHLAEKAPIAAGINTREVGDCCVHASRGPRERVIRDSPTLRISTEENSRYGQCIRSHGISPSG